MEDVTRVETNIKTDPEWLAKLKEPEVDFSRALIAAGRTYVDAWNVINTYFPEVAKVGPGPSHRLHAEFLSQATDRARELIYTGEMDDLSARDSFEALARIHQGINPLEHAVAYFDPTHSALESIWSDPQISTAAITIDARGDLYGFGWGNLRKTHLDMSKNGTEFIIGVPAEIVPTLAEEFFPEVERLVEEKRKQWLDLSSSTKDTSDDLRHMEEEVILFTTAAATLADIIHFKADCNGRITEDWGLSLQRRIFGENTRLKSWVMDNMRAKQEEDLVKDEYTDQVHAGNLRLEERAERVNPLRKEIMDQIKERLRDLLQGEDKKKYNAIISKQPYEDKLNLDPYERGENLDKILDSYPETVLEVFRNKIAELKEINPYALDTISEPGLRFVGKGRNDDYGYTSFDRGEVFKEPSVVTDFVGLHQKAVELLNTDIKRHESTQKAQI